MAEGSSRLSTVLRTAIRTLTHSRQGCFQSHSMTRTDHFLSITFYAEIKKKINEKKRKERKKEKKEREKEREMNEREEIQDHRDVALERTDDIVATRSLSSLLEQSSQNSVNPKRRRGTIASEGMHINLAHLQCMEDVDDVQYHINRRRRHLRSAQQQQSSRTSSFLQEKVVQPLDIGIS